MRAQPLGAAPPGCCARTTAAAATADNSTKARIALAADLAWKKEIESGDGRTKQSFNFKG